MNGTDPVNKPPPPPPDDPRMVAMKNLMAAYTPEQVGRGHWEMAWSILQTDPAFTESTDSPDVNRDLVKEYWPPTWYQYLTTNPIPLS